MQSGVRVTSLVMNRLQFCWQMTSSKVMYLLLTQMVKEFDRLRASMMAIVEVPKEETYRYGIIESRESV